MPKRLYTLNLRLAFFFFATADSQDVLGRGNGVGLRLYHKVIKDDACLQSYLVGLEWASQRL